MATSKKVLGFYETFSDAQTETTIITPSSGDYLFVWMLCVESDGYYKMYFPTAGTLIEGNGGITGMANICKYGADDEVVKLTCDANTTVRVLYHEV
jgi:hypothetical protein